MRVGSMKISRLILDLVKYRLKGYKMIDFWIGYEYPPSDICNFVVSDCNYDKSITLRNWIDEDNK